MKGKSQPRKDGSYARRSPTKSKQKTLLIVCEGETEETYFKCICQKYRLSSVEIICAGGGYQSSAVDLAIKKLEEEYDQIWSVFDTEKYTDKKQLDEAVSKARGQQKKVTGRVFEIAVSNPSVEYWLFLHFADRTPSLQDSSEAQEKLKEVVPKYDKNQQVLKNLFPSTFLPQLETAISNAEKCLKQMQEISEDEFPNPSSTIFKLIKEIKKLIENKLY